MSVQNKSLGLVSIVMPAYNSSNFIEKSIASVLAQSYCDWELIIVDDNSSDDTVDKSRALADADERIRVFVNARNFGAAYSRNRALREVRGEWVAFLDSDDLWMPEKLEEQLNFMINHDCAFSYAEYVTIDESGKLLGKRYSGPSCISKSGMRKYCWPGCLTVMFDRRKVGLFQIADLKKHNDYAMWLKVAERAECLLLPKVLGEYRVRKTSVSHGIGIRSQVSHLYALWHCGEGLNYARSFYRTLVNLLFGVYKKIRYSQSAS